VKNQWRYAIGCKEQDCIGVIGPSVKAVIRMWVAECEANESSDGAAGCGPNSP
jgi:hypothetical protein